MFTNTGIYAQGLLLCRASGSSSGEHEDKRTKGHALSFANRLLIKQGHNGESSYVYEQLTLYKLFPAEATACPVT